MASTSTSIPAQSQPTISVWSSEAPIAPVGHASRKALPIKRNDAEFLTREDVQYNLLNHIFSDTKAVFTQTPGKPYKVTFRDLYVNALYHSSKCSKVLKEKMNETPAFALELAKISLLTNVGRINTTMAFFPEMKTALRTYHPVPSLQKTDGNAQDAPRIKNCLKAALLPSEVRSVPPPSTPEEILQKSRAGQRPPTSVVNLVFVLSNHAAPLSAVHFDTHLNFLDLFLPKQLASADRAKAFLWHAYHYLETPGTPNPFDDDYSAKHPGKAPYIRRISHAEMIKENVDTREEIEWGNRMSGERYAFLQKLVQSLDSDRKNKAPHFVPEASASSASTTTRFRRRTESSKDEGAFMYYVPGRDVPGNSPPDRPHPRVQPRLKSNTNAQGPRSRDQRSMLQQAWHLMVNSDPLVDSDEENPDEHIRRDYTRRLEVITRISGRAPTPDRSHSQSFESESHRQGLWKKS